MPDPSGSIDAISLSLKAGEAASRLLCVCAETYSSWFMAMRSAIRRERYRQQLYREDNGLPARQKVPYIRPTLSAAEEAIARMSESMVRATFGDSTADYAKGMFLHAISTGDMRAFKIRLLLIRTRDSLKGTSLYRDFSNGLEDCIASAELMAGCVPDPSPRRLSISEKKRKRLKDAALMSIPELPLIWPGQEGYDIIQDAGVNSEDKSVSPGTQDNGETQYIEHFDALHSDGESSKNDSEDSENIFHEKNVRRTNNSSGKRAKKKPVRKVRDYETVDEILEDIDEGRISPYESSDEICEDLKDGTITPVEAFMFTAALERYSPSVFGRIEDRHGEAEEDESEDGNEDVDGDGDGIEDEEEEGNGEYGYEDEEVCGSFSYNPRGFAGCSGNMSQSGAEWNTDDEC